MKRISPADRQLIYLVQLITILAVFAVPYGSLVWIIKSYFWAAVTYVVGMVCLFILGMISAGFIECIRSFFKIMEILNAERKHDRKRANSKR
jgi:hypothetical protein